MSLSADLNREGVNKFGANYDVDTGATGEDIWTAGGIWVPPTAACIHAITSLDANDTSAGTGMRTILVKGLDAIGYPQEEIVIMAGVADVNTTKTYLRIYRMIGLTAGSGGKNAGVISATAASGGTVTAEIPVGDSQTQMAVFTVPKGVRGLLYRVYMDLLPNTPAAATVLAKLAFRSLDADAPEIIKTINGVSALVPLNHRYHGVYPVIDELTDVKLRATEASANNILVSGGFDIGFIPTGGS